LFMPLIEEKPFSVYELRKITDPIFYTWLSGFQFETDGTLKWLSVAYGNQVTFDAVPFSQLTFDKLSESLQTKHYDPKYNLDVVELKRLRIYKTDAQPIWIFNDKTKEIHRLEEVSLIIQNQSSLIRERKMIVYNKNLLEAGVSI
jgi:hypothetical protein